jgi:hypothetical protein
MGLTQTLARSAARRPHLLLAEMPGSFLVRLAVEAEVRRRRWALAASPADADVLVVCGTFVQELREPVDMLFDQMPGPRARCAVAAKEDVCDVLARARDVLVDMGHQRSDARDRVPADQALDAQHEDMEHEDMEHGGMDHGDMGMSPAGIPLAESGEDRDGLEMDVLHLPLGPVLPYWPAGLVLRCSLHGDVVTEAEVEKFGQRSRPGEEDREMAAARNLDAVVSVLTLAGWPAGAARARRARDLCAGLTDGDAAREVAALRRAVRRNWSLRWMLRGIGTVSAPTASTLPPLWHGDVWDRLLTLMDQSVAPRGGGPAASVDWSRAVDTLPDVVAGGELASVRLTVASLAPEWWVTDPDPAHA